jgi:(1->4)-alpha-D-glucan 1-alpha-D-glucosylmutase
VAANALAVEPRGAAALERAYRRLGGLALPFADLVAAEKRRLARALFAGEVAALVRSLGALAEADVDARDFLPSQLEAAILAASALLPIYRSYAAPGRPLAHGRAALERSLDAAAGDAVAAPAVPSCVGR